MTDHTYEPDPTLALVDQIQFSDQLRLGAGLVSELPIALALGDGDPWPTFNDELVSAEQCRAAVAAYGRWLLLVAEGEQPDDCVPCLAETG